MELLDVLHDYWLAGRFPQNETHLVRTPVFIDAYGTFCAVGYLLEKGGGSELARSVAAQNNFVYLPDLASPALDDWAEEHGFTRDELAWIQPTYSPMYHAASVGGGTNGSVNELLVSSDGQKLYVGGQFTHVNGTLAAPNVAFVTENAGAYAWHNIGTGLGGRITALAEWDGKLFAGGNGVIAQGPVSGSLAFWNGTIWTMAGQTSGDVYDLAVFRDTLYAAGLFSTASGTANFARWNGSQWIPVAGISGTVHTMEAVGTHLFLGGNFRFGTDSVNAIRWSSTTSFQPFANRMMNEVRDFEVFKDTVYASCKLLKPKHYFWPGGVLGGSDTNLVCRLVGNSWTSIPTLPLYPMNLFDTMPSRNTSINALCAWNDTLISGGDLACYPMAGTNVAGIAPVVQPSSSFGARWFLVDSAVNKIVVFKGALIAGGRMKENHWTQFNGICRQVYSLEAASVAKPLTQSPSTTLSIHPNPVKAGADIGVRAPIAAQEVWLVDAAGRRVWGGKTEHLTEMRIPAPVAAGTYIVEWHGSGGIRASEKVVVR